MTALNEYLPLDAKSPHKKCIQTALDSVMKIEFETKIPLVILDMNGVLVEKVYLNQKSEGYKAALAPYLVPKDGEEPWSVVGNMIIRRTKQGESILSKISDKGCRIAIWSSGYNTNVMKWVKALYPQWLKKFFFIWGQSECKEVPRIQSDNPEDAEKNRKPIFTKPLSSVWEAFPQYNETNTMIVDDSEEKMQENPKQCVVIVPSDDLTDDNLSMVVSKALTL
jgi:hypothetical protein